MELNKDHPHAEVLLSIAGGVPLGEFEVKSDSCDWVPMDRFGGYGDWVVMPDRWQVRRKQQYIIVNGFKVPKPLAFIPAEGVFVPMFHDDELCEHWKSFNPKETSVNRGVAHSTKEAAIAHAKAMLGIDPEYFK